MPFSTERPAASASSAAEPSRTAPGGEQPLLIGVLLALIVPRTGRVEVERGDPPAEAEVDAELLGSLPDGALLAAAPELLRQRRPLVRWVRLRADERDCRPGVVLPYCFR